MYHARLLAACALLLGACAPADTTAPTSRNAVSLDLVGPEATDDLTDATSEGFGHSPLHQSVTGHGNLTVGGALRTFSFSAVRHRDGTVTGEFELKSRATGARIHGTVTCFFAFARPLDPDRGAAFLAGRVDHSENGPAPGTLVIFNAFDNGEGANALFPDFMSLLQPVGSQLVVERQCRNGLALRPVLPIEGGNIQVRP